MAPNQRTKAKLTIEPDESGGSRVMVEHTRLVESLNTLTSGGQFPKFEEQSHSRLFYMAPGEVMNFRVQDGMIVFEKHVSPNSSDLAGNFVTGLLSGLSGVIK